MNVDHQAATLNAAMIESLDRDLDLSGDIKHAFAENPRHRFAPGGYFLRSDSPGPTAWRPVLPEDPEWLQGCYSDAALVTQIANTILPRDVRGEIMREPTSSSSMPSLVAFVLQNADLKPGMRVLEIGAGTGWNAALLCTLTGDDENVVTIDTDPNVASFARSNLYGAGHSPEVVAGDGRYGYAEQAPYDALIATCGFPRIYPDLLGQVKPGGVIVAGIVGRLGSAGLAKLVKQPDGTAQGRYISEGNYMLAREETAPHNIALPDPADGETRPTHVGHSVLSDNAALVLADTIAPTFQRLPQFSMNGEPAADWFVNSETGSFAIVTEHNDGTATVNEGGPIRIWNRIESAIDRWRTAGTPPVDQFRITATPQGLSVTP